MKRPRLLWPSDAIARAPVSIYAKLLAAFLVIVGLLIAVGAVSLAELAAVNLRAEDQVKLQRKIAAYRQVQQDTMSQLYGVSSALLVPENRTLDATVRQLNQFGYDLDRLQFVAADEVELFGRVRKDYEAFISVVGEVVGLIRAGKGAEGREAQIGRAGPLAERLERLTNELVNKAEADMVARVDEGHDAYIVSRRLVVAFALGSILLALGLGYSLSWSLIGPVKQMEVRFAEIATGDFTRQVDVRNRDELGTLAANLNRMNAELGSLYRQVEIANRNKSEFLANMSHELRTPLNAVIGFSEVLLERMFGELNDKQADYLKDIHDSGRHLLSLINDILDLSKIEAGRMELDLEEFDVAEALANAMTLVRERAQSHGIALMREADPALGSMRGDQRKFKQILLNLLSNALKFTPDGGQVAVRAALTGDRLEVSVTDTGIGIAEADHEAVFEEFRQVGRHYTNKNEGTGLGLALTRRFVELHGGTIRVTSTLGHGSTFTFNLPLSPVPTVPPVPTESLSA